MKFLLVAAAAAALGVPASANAQYGYGQYGYGQYGRGYAGVSDWDYDDGRYALFEREYRHTIDGIRHGLSDGTFSRWQADRFYRELEGIRYDAMRSMRYGNYQDRFIQARMARLHARMHFKHERNHERYDGYGSYGNYGGYQPNYHDHDDD
jgi:opacity protein-like surface antigen